MKNLYIGNERVAKIIEKKNINKEALFKLTIFSFFYTTQNEILVLNVLSGAVYKLTENEYIALLKLKDIEVDYKYIDDNGLIELVHSRIIVENNYKDNNKYLDIIKMLKIMEGKKAGIRKYTILPTTFCNARCVYCYEQNYVHNSMSEKTAERLVKYIEDTKNSGSVRLAWFGGEPLVGHKIISQICRSLKDNNIEFKSEMISNGALFSKEIVKEALENWNLKSVQISLDGEKSDYENRKHFINPNRDNYESVMNNILTLAENGVKVVLRSNFDNDNIDSLKDLIDDLSIRFVGLDNIKIYFHTLYQLYESEEYENQLQKIKQIYDYAKKKKMKVVCSNPSGLKLHLCMADDNGRSVVISPEGKIFSCEHMPENKTWGNIFNGITDQEEYEKYKEVSAIDKECEKCCFLPFCTSFYKKGCPNSHNSCYLARKFDVERQLDNLIDDLKEKGEL